jgi:hypothetical protein
MDKIRGRLNLEARMSDAAEQVQLQHACQEVSIEWTYAGSQALHMWECSDYIQNYPRYILN